MIVFDETGFNEARKSPYYFSRSDISDDDKRAMLRKNLEEAIEESDRGEVIPAEEAYALLKAEFAAKRKLRA